MPRIKKTAQRFALAILACAFIQATPGTAVYAETTFIFTGTAVAPITDGDINKARSDALAEAKRQAVEAAVEKFISSIEYDQKRRAIDKKIVHNADRFFITCENISEKEIENHYQIVIEARVDGRRLIDAVKALPAPLSKGTDPLKTTLVLITKGEGAGRKRNRPLEKAVCERFETIGLTPVDEEITRKIFKDDVSLELEAGRFNALIKIRQSVGLRYAFIGRAFDQDYKGVAVSGYRIYFADLLKGDVVAGFPYKTHDGKVDRIDDPARGIWSEFMEKIQGKGVVDDVGVVETKVYFIGLRDYSDIDAIQNAVKAIPSFVGVILDSAASGKEVSFMIRYEGRLADMIRDIESLKYNGFQLQEIPSAGGRLIFRVSSR